MRPKPTAAPLSCDPDAPEQALATIYRALPLDPARNPSAAPIGPRGRRRAAMITTLRPRGPIEAARAAAAHFGSLECLRRAMLPDLPENARFRLRGKTVALPRMNMFMIRQVMHRQAVLGAPARPADGTVMPKPAADAMAVAQRGRALDRGPATPTHTTRAGVPGHTPAGTNPAGRRIWSARPHVQ
jgi:hypothetical protein